MNLYSVDLYIYDLSQGLAKNVIPLLMNGKEIDGIWHTGVVVFGREYFFGSNGVQFVSPGTTILGHTYKIMSMGSTQVTQDIFEDYLKELADSSFRSDSYHLLDHNCNNFSDEVCFFLVGKNIPNHITNLPKEFLNSTVGGFLRPFIDEIYKANNQTLTSPSNSSNLLNDQTSSDSVDNLNNSGSQIASTLMHFVQNSEWQPGMSSEIGGQQFLCAILPTHHAVDDVAILLVHLETIRCLDAESRIEIRNCLLNQTCFSPRNILQNINKLGKLITERNNPQSLVACQLLQALMENYLVTSEVIKFDSEQTFFELLEDFASSPEDPELLKVLIKCVCNMLYHSELSGQFLLRQSSCCDVVINFLVSCTLIRDDEITNIACQSISNAFLAIPNEACSDICFKLGISLLEMVQKDSLTDTIHIWFSIYQCLKRCSELLQFAHAINFDVDKIKKKYEIATVDENIKKLKDSVKNLMRNQPLYF